MRKNQKYNPSEMFLAIELWQESGMSQKAFCERENLSLSTFGYWLRKYKKEKTREVEPGSVESFIPVKVPGLEPMEHSSNVLAAEQIMVSFPNGVRVSCPAGIDMNQLRNLVNF